MLRETATVYNFELTKYQSTEFVQFCLRRTRIKHIHSNNKKQSKFSTANTVGLHSWSASWCHKHTVHNHSRRGTDIVYSRTLLEISLNIVSIFKRCDTRETKEMLQLMTQSRKQWTEIDRKKTVKCHNTQVLVTSTAEHFMMCFLAPCLLLNVALQRKQLNCL